MIASAKGYLDMIDLMSQNESIDVNKTDKNGVNAFWIAAWYGRVETMRKLLSMRVDPLATNQNGSNALHIAVKLGHFDAVRELIRLKNFPVDSMKKNGVTSMGISAYRGNVQMMEMLAERSNLQFVNSQGIGPMYLAVKGNKTDSIRFLLSRRVPIFNNQPDKTDNSPIFFAIRQSNLNALEIFCDAEQNNLENFRDSKGYSLIMHACTHARFEVVNYLSVRRIDLNV